MSIRKLFSSIFIFLLKIFCRPRSGRVLPSSPQKFLVIRQHNQFGDMLATIPLFRAIKENYPHSEITLFASPENYFAVTKNKYIDSVFNFDKKALYGISYLKQFFRVLRKGYDVVLVPVTVSISSTSSILARMAKSEYTIGPSSLDGQGNKLSFLFDCPLELDWRRDPELNVARFIFGILAPLKVKSSNFSSHVTFDDSDIRNADEFISSLGFSPSRKLVGFHVGAGKPPNRWPLERFVSLIERLEEDFGIEFFFTGSNSDREQIDYMKNKFGNTAGYFLNRSIPELAAVIAKCTLFITNDTGVMHVAGAVDVPQISIFGPTNPNNWAPLGENKFNIRNSENINSVSVDEVYSQAKRILSGDLKK